MSYITERREDERARKRAAILDAAEILYAKNGWDALTVEEVARTARLSRALVYVYFRDKEDLLFAIGERAMRSLRDRIRSVTSTSATGLDQIEAIGRAYMGYAQQLPHYFNFCSRFQSHSVTLDPTSNEVACSAAGDQAVGMVVRAIETGIRDGSIRADIGDPRMLATTLWAFTHGFIQLAMAKGAGLARRGIAVPQFSDGAFRLLRRFVRSGSSD
jgi:AcrR family transcriptional regulator